MNQFLLGALASAFLVAAMFFARFFKRTRDRFFAFVSTAFAMMGVNQLTLAVLGEESEFQSWPYLVRLAAFVLILIAIYDKNRR
jgi:hypothetical protein